jgi:hypothetical protein
LLRAIRVEGVVDQGTRWPDGFDPEAAGVIFEELAILVGLVVGFEDFELARGIRQVIKAVAKALS